MAPATASDGSLPTLLSSLTAALDSAATALPDTVVPPENGLSLLDIKNDLFLSYLQNLVFLILLKLRNLKDKSHSIEKEEQTVDEDVVKKLVELRVYLERGVRPLENRLKYQIDKVVRAAETASKPAPASKAYKPSRAARNAPSDSDDPASDSDSQASNNAASDISDLAHRPNPSAFARPASHSAATDPSSTTTMGGSSVYRPPKITATAMPELSQRPSDRGARQAPKSAALDEFIAEELSAAPRSESAFGPAVAAGGRRTLSQRERADMAERTAYEEANYVRLPGLSKKERAKKGYERRVGYGGEDWREIGEGVDRIERLTRGKAGKGNVLEKSRKRSAAATESADLDIGRGFEKRRKMGRRRR